MSRTRGSDQALALAQGLGWFSIALGVAQVLAPHRVTRATGLQGQERLISSYGMREIATGIGLLTAKDPTPWVWGRVGGDALDIGTLAAGIAGPERERSGMAMLVTLGIAALDVGCALALRRPLPAAMAGFRKRSGLPKPAGTMRGAAQDFVVPADMRTPEALRPWQ
ncbi:cyclase dehydrase [Paeniroseomonas aquatica]|uniref:Cyclase dehydrase n=1 Tax=Paeniroseomonas aquatica TaxID=373043 RepID=A0ABT8A7Q5_9PROT|nr:cyclase dehydrase [Paeniroseomonas aquatica]MDN3565731.1 cyclase dehydrase [Paeniroseomonas aquatica]